MPSATGPHTYYEVLTAAVNDIAEHGYDSAARLAYWQEELRKAAERTLRSAAQMEEDLRTAMADLYRRLVEKGGIAKYHPGIARFTLEQLRPRLRNELDKRILASADLIKLNRKQAIEKTLQRFSGWTTSVPPGGTKTADKVKLKTDIKKSMKQLPFEERRVIIDQNAKLVSSISNVVATNGGAIAYRWHSHWRASGYDYRPDHKLRDGKIYLLRESWAKEQGLVRAGEAGYSDEITQPAEEPFCRCGAEYIYTLSQLPTDMLTAKGKEKLLEVRRAMANET